jgi:AraC family chitin signaling transcriptional activator
LKTLLSLFLFLNIILVSSQEMPPLHNYEPSLYHAGNQNWMVSESDDHFIYVANNEGLLEYNGSQWTLYKTPNESIMRSVKAQGDRIYTGCYMDFGYWIRDDSGRLNYTSIIEKTKFQLQEDEQFWNIIVKNDYVLFQSRSRIYFYDIDSGEVSQIAEQTEINKFFQVGDTYYYHVLGEGLFQVVNKQPQLKGSTDFFLEETIILMFEYHSKVYVLTQDAAVYLYQDGEVTLVGSCELNQKITVYSAALLSNNNLLLGTIANGVISMDLEGKVNYARLTKVMD